MELISVWPAISFLVSLFKIEQIHILRDDNSQMQEIKLIRAIKCMCVWESIVHSSMDFQLLLLGDTLLLFFMFKMTFFFIFFSFFFTFWTENIHPWIFNAFRGLYISCAKCYLYTLLSWMWAREWICMHAYAWLHSCDRMHVCVCLCIFLSVTN